MSLNSPSVPAALLLPAALGALALAQIPGPRRWVMTRALRAAQAKETRLDASLDEWHEYGLRWMPRMAEVQVDGRQALTVEDPPRSPLGLVIWIDNQYAIASPENGFRFGIVPTAQEQWLEIEGLSLALA